MPATQKFILSILPIGKKYLVIFSIYFGWNIIFYKTRHMYYHIVKNKGVKRIDHISCFEWEVSPADYKC